MDYVSYNQKWRESLNEAVETARFLGYKEVTPGCILIGLLRTNGTLAEEFLKSVGITKQKALGVVSQLEGICEVRNTQRDVEMPYNQPAVDIVELAKQSGEEMQHSYRGPEHLVCGIGRSKDPLVIKMLGLLGTQGQLLDEDIQNLLGYSKAAA